MLFDTVDKGGSFAFLTARVCCFGFRLTVLCAFIKASEGPEICARFLLFIGALLSLGSFCSLVYVTFIMAALGLCVLLFAGGATLERVMHGLFSVFCRLFEVITAKPL